MMPSPECHETISYNLKNAKLNSSEVVSDVIPNAENNAGFVTPIQITKSAAARQIASILRRSRVDYEESKALFKQARELVGLTPERKPKKQPALLTDSELKRFFDSVDRGSNLQYQLMVRLLYFTGVRVSELSNIKRIDVDLESCTIRIEQGKGSKDRTTLFPEGLKLPLSAYINAAQGGVYLFESRQCRRFTSRRIEQIVSAFAEQAGLDGRVHPHLFRHMCLTRLTRQGLTDAQIQLLSGHASKKSLEVYQHLSLASVTADYQKAMAGGVL